MTCLQILRCIAVVFAMFCFMVCAYNYNETGEEGYGFWAIISFIAFMNL